MRIYTPTPDSIERLSFLDTFDTCRGSEPNWHMITVGQHHHRDIPDPSFFRLGRVEDDDGFPQWRPVFATPVAVWCTDVCLNDTGSIEIQFDDRGLDPCHLPRVHHGPRLSPRILWIVINGLDKALEPWEKE